MPDEGLVQVSYVLLISVAFSLFHGYLQPFESRYDDRLQVVASVSTLMLGFYALLIKTGTTVDPALGWLMLILNIIPLLLLVVLLLYVLWISSSYVKAGVVGSVRLGRLQFQKALKQSQVILGDTSISTVSKAGEGQVADAIPHPSSHSKDSFIDPDDQAVAGAPMADNSTARDNNKTTNACADEAKSSLRQSMPSGDEDSQMVVGAPKARAGQDS